MYRSSNVLLISMYYIGQTVRLLKEIVAVHCMNYTKNILYIHSVGTMEGFIVLMKVVSRALQSEGHCQVKILTNHAQHLGCECHQCVIYLYHYYTCKAVHKPTSQLLGRRNFVRYQCASDIGRLTRFINCTACFWISLHH
jgi:hypothetical protein